MATMGARIGRLEDGQHEIQRQLTARFDACTRMLHSLMGAAAFAGQMPPRLVWIYPRERQMTERLFRPSSWLHDPLYLTFVCPITWKVAFCGEDGNGFKNKLTKPCIVRAAPYLLVGLEVIRWACAVGRIAGLPLPADQGLVVAKDALLVERVQTELVNINDDPVAAERTGLGRKLVRV